MKRYYESYQKWSKARNLILNGVATLSKSPEHIAPGACPVFAERAKGAYFWDCDENRYIDYPLALGPIILGHAYDEVDDAVKRQMADGFLFSLTHKKEIELAELLCEIIPCAEKVRFLKSGSEAMSAAIRIARAYTEKEMVAVCGYHGWHDWTIVRTDRNNGVPDALKGTVREFVYNDIDSLERIFRDHADGVAAVILEPVGMYPPGDNFLEKVAALARKNGALLVFEEIITGFRLHVGGAQAYFSVTPDLSAFGKAMANGYPLSVLVGKKEILDAVEERVFISSTYGGEILSITAALKTIDILISRNVNDYILNLGGQLKDGLNALLTERKMNARCEGLSHKTFMVFGDMNGTPGELIETAFRQECLYRGVFLGYGHFISYSHSVHDIHHSLEVAGEVLDIICRSIEKEQLPALLAGKVATRVFRRY